MTWITQHLTRCFLAGILALLPIGGTLLLVTHLESSIASSWLARQSFYFPGCGLLVVAVATYAVGLFVSTFVGRWIWNGVDRLLRRLPLLGWTYQTLKQILGYGDGPDALFQRVVLVPSSLGESRDPALGQAVEIGLVTREFPGPDGQPHYIVFLPQTPTPTMGRMVQLPASQVTLLDVTPHAALRTLVSLGKMPLVEPEQQ